MSPPPHPDSHPSTGASNLGELFRGPFMWVTAANFTYFLCFASFFLLPQYLRDLGASKDEIGDIFAIFGLTGIPLTPLVGMLIDRYRRRPVFIFGAILMWAASLSFAFVDQLSLLLYVLRALQGISFACCFTAATTLAADLSPPDRRAQALGIFGVFTLITHGLAVIIAEFIVSHLGFKGLFYIISSWCLLAALLFTRVPETRHSHSDARGSSLLKLITSAALFPPIAVATLAGVGFGVALTFVPILGEVIRIEHVSIFFLCYVGAAIFVRIFGGRLADVYGRRAVAAPSLAILAASIIGLAFIGGDRGLALVGLAFGTGHGFLYPALNAFVVDVSRPEDRGKAMSLYNAAFNLGITLGAVVFGRVAEAEGYDKMFIAAGLTVLLGLPFFLVRFEDSP